MQEDPLGADSNLYLFVNNSPILLRDPFGLKPGDLFDNPDSAATEAILNISPTSNLLVLEYAGRIYRTGDGKYSYTAPIQGGSDYSSPGIWPAGTVNIGYYHTHPTLRGHLTEIFSDADIEVADYRTELGYLGTPSGRILKYVPSILQIGSLIKADIIVLKERNRKKGGKCQ